MGNNHKIPPKNKIPLNEDVKYFRPFQYTKDYFEVKSSDLFLEYIDVKCQNVRSKLDSNSLNNIREYLGAVSEIRGMKLPLRNQEVENISRTVEVLFDRPELRVLSLNLGFSKMNDKQLAEFIISMKRLENLIDLDMNLSFTLFGKSSLSALCGCLAQFLNLNELGLELEAVELKGPDFFPLLEKIGELKNLCDLSLRIYESNIGDEGMKLLSNSLKQIECLSGLLLRVNNNITNDGLDILLNTLIEKKDRMVSLHILMNLNPLTDFNKIFEVLESQKYLMELVCCFSNVVNAETCVSKLLQMADKSLYLFRCLIMNHGNSRRMKRKACILPILQTITSNLRRRKYRTEVIDEVVEVLLKNS